MTQLRFNDEFGYTRTKVFMIGECRKQYGDYGIRKEVNGLMKVKLHSFLQISAFLTNLSL
uniref:Uncharacterized protein n=1 Tax=Rhizophora mucronata TaxID=61149 RepID=A0A2P2Q3S5_RHIMU